VPNTCSHNGHLYYVLLPSLERRTELIARMKADDIGTPFHYVPLHSSPAGRRFARTPGPMPNTDVAGATLVRLPLFPKIDESKWRVIDRLTSHLDAIL
jgi:dTDP-4-amino-4,6-dideoxygalactose transaminase